jgi:hypothetical protein
MNTPFRETSSSRVDSACDAMDRMPFVTLEGGMLGGDSALVMVDIIRSALEVTFTVALFTGEEEEAKDFPSLIYTHGEHQQTSKPTKRVGIF